MRRNNGQKVVAEPKIRNYLANHLDCLEKGLSFIQKEFYLPNPSGASGKVDILARDKYGCHVLIEIKRSDQSSREALHELHKYFALYRMKMGLSASAIRCIIVSTTWHELLIPFSEYSRSSTHMVEGFAIEVEDDGKIISANKVEPLETADEITICPVHIIYLFEKAVTMKTGIDQCITGLSSLNIDDYCLVEIAYEGPNEAVIYPYGIYVVISALTEKQKIEESESRKIDPSEFDSESSPFYIEETIISDLNELVCCDSIEIGYPEKFLALENWPVKGFYRSGKYKSLEKIVDDDELRRLIAGIGGQNIYYYQGFSSPRHKSHWVSTIENAKYTLIGNEEWGLVVEWFAELAYSSFSNSDVSIRIFNPANIIGSLYKLCTTHQMSYLPNIEIVAVSEDRAQTCIIYGFVSWNGTIVTDDVIQIICSLYGDTFSYFATMHFGESYINDPLIMNRLGLCYSALMIEYPNLETEKVSYLSFDGDTIHKKGIRQFNDRPIGDFIREHNKLISSIIELFEKNMIEIQTQRT